MSGFSGFSHKCNWANKEFIIRELKRDLGLAGDKEGKHKGKNTAGRVGPTQGEMERQEVLNNP